MVIIFLMFIVCKTVNFYFQFTDPFEVNKTGSLEVLVARGFSTLPQISAKCFSFLIAFIMEK